MSTAPPISKNSIDEDTVKKVLDFYHTENVSRQLPGMNDTISVTVAGGIIEKRMKKLLLLSLKEAHILFKATHLDIKIGLSKFCELRPKEVILPNGKGTHNVCVCESHQNVKLALDNSGLAKSNPLNLSDSSYKGYIDLMTCQEATDKCYLNDCKKCDNKDTSEYENSIREHLEESGSNEIKIHQWENTDRSNLVVKLMPVDEFVEYLFEKLRKLKTHNYIAKQQTKFFTDRRKNLKFGEVLINGDFAENYNFLVQNSAQGFHWNKTTCTIHPFVVNYMKNGKLVTMSFAFISDDIGMLF